MIALVERGREGKVMEVVAFRRLAKMLLRFAPECQVETIGRSTSWAGILSN